MSDLVVIQKNWFSHDAAQFMSYLLVKPEGRFSRDAAYFMEHMQKCFIDYLKHALSSLLFIKSLHDLNRWNLAALEIRERFTGWPSSRVSSPIGTC